MCVWVHVCLCLYRCLNAKTYAWKSEENFWSQVLSSILLRQGLSCYCCIAYSRLARDSKRLSCFRLSSYSRSTRIAGVCHHIQLVYMAPGLNPRPQVCKTGAFICWVVSLALCFWVLTDLERFFFIWNFTGHGYENSEHCRIWEKSQHRSIPLCRPST